MAAYPLSTAERYGSHRQSAWPWAESQRDSVFLAQGCGNAATLGVRGEKNPPPFPNPNGVASFPHKPLIIFHAVFAKKRAVFFLKCLFFVMRPLAGYVFARFVYGGCTNGKSTITSLPRKPRQSGFSLFDPDAGNPFDFFYPIGLRNGSGQSAKKMHMVFCAAHDDRKAIQFLRDSAQIGVHFFPDFRVPQKWLTAFR